MADQQSTRRPPRGWWEHQGAWWPRRRLKRWMRKARLAQGFSRRDAHRWPE